VCERETERQTRSKRCVHTGGMPGACARCVCEGVREVDANAADAVEESQEHMRGVCMRERERESR